MGNNSRKKYYAVLIFIRNLLKLNACIAFGVLNSLYEEIIRDPHDFKSEKVFIFVFYLHLFSYYPPGSRQKKNLHPA